ncbi:MAG: MBL fold metallo-hydrolase [bacterium]|nr:MBL fold metallo-hydrolase [bacterium]
MIRVWTLKHPWLVPGFWTSMLLMEGRSCSFLIDSAVKGAVEATLAPFLRERRIPWSAVRQVLNSHSHGDHVECNARLRELSGAVFSIHRNGANSLRASGFTPDRELADGDEVRDGDVTARIFHTPGHSDDSVCILEPETGTLFTGDAVQGRGSDNIGLALYADPTAYRNSLKRIRRLCASGEVRRMVLGHPERPSDGEIEQPELLPFLDLCIETADGYMRTAEELLKRNPQAGKAELRDLLLNRFGGSASLSWPELSYNTADALLRALRF